MRKNSIKNTRVNAEVQHELANLIREGIKDPRIHPMTSVTAVEVAPDLKTCKSLYQCSGRRRSEEKYHCRLKRAQKVISADSLQNVLILEILRKSVLFWTNPLNMELPCRNSLMR